MVKSKNLLLILTAAIFTLYGCGGEEKEIVNIYVSEDMPFSKPVLKEFEKQSGIKVNALYDSEESKSSGVVNRLIAEKNNPQADLYWANEPIRAEILRKKGVLTPYKSPNIATIDKNFIQKDYYWSGFSARVRLFIVKKGLKNMPKSIFDYTNEKFKAKAVIANPLFGTTTAHIASLFVKLGDKKAKEFLEKLKSNKVAISTSNGESADLVAKGRYDFSLVDSDDAISRLKDGKSVEFVYPDQGKDDLGAFVIPNCVMLIKGSKHPKNAKKLIDFLLSKKSEQILAKLPCEQIPLHKGLLPPKDLKSIEQIRVMRVDYEKVADKLLKIQALLKEWSKR
jgi:iron(III) transport system substrate-binding protein